MSDPEEESESKKVMVITYYWPPSGGSGVQRWLKFVKYLPQFGWQPYVFTPENPAFDLKDESLLKDIPPEAEVLHFPIWEPYGLFNKLSGGGVQVSANSAPKADSLFSKLSIWIRGNFFIPDPRVFWVRPSVKFLDDFLREKRIRHIITTGPPHSVHLIGLGLKKRNPSLKWTADFRDPWSEWGFLDTLKLSKLARKTHQQLEKKVLTTADKVTTITPFYVRHFQRLGGRKVNLLTNGYDEEDFQDFKTERPDRFVIRHVGIVNEKCNPIPFMEALASLCVKHAEFKNAVQVDFVGQVNARFANYVKEHAVLKTITTLTPNIPHKEVVKLYGKSALLLLVLTGYKDAEGYMPGKLFEYLATGLPVLGIGPEQGDAADLLNKSGAGVMIHESQQQQIKDILLHHFIVWENSGSNSSQLGNEYSRKAMTARLTEILD
ncbi:glycosyl transferase [Chryseotalea sanaruensis]|uniref:Glycosyl transferase n=1 Tax=Chryseotalea sanaruensis TaxID=2482724 RepID=A0A401U4U4_9BACT|nr:glycosyl transferase [Chryseotalea sanaruensis]GCC49902.1 glycosyl transferase [Chryseotalea sanaruensis]